MQCKEIYFIFFKETKKKEFQYSSVGGPYEKHVNIVILSKSRVFVIFSEYGLAFATQYPPNN